MTPVTIQLLGLCLVTVEAVLQVSVAGLLSDLESLVGTRLSTKLLNDEGAYLV